jgi:hypothetical protein
MTMKNDLNILQRITVWVFITGVAFGTFGMYLTFPILQDIKNIRGTPFSRSVSDIPTGANAEWGYSVDTAYRVLARYNFRGEPMALIETPLGNLFVSVEGPILNLKPGTFFEFTDNGLVTLKREEAILMRVPNDHFDEGCPLTDEEIRKVIEQWDREETQRSAGSSSA